MFYTMNKLRHSPYFYTASGYRRQRKLCRRSVCPFYAFFPNPLTTNRAVKTSFFTALLLFVVYLKYFTAALNI